MLVRLFDKYELSCPGTDIMGYSKLILHNKESGVELKYKFVAKREDDAFTMMNQEASYVDDDGTICFREEEIYEYINDKWIEFCDVNNPIGVGRCQIIGIDSGMCINQFLLHIVAENREYQLEKLGI